jgi:hypothetical protein
MGKISLVYINNKRYAASMDVYRRASRTILCPSLNTNIIRIGD